MTINLKKIRKNAEDLNPKLVDTRRTIHKNPELGFEEEETAKLIIQRLEELGIEYESGIAKTGVVGTIEGNGEGKTLLIRADMDALPLTEDNEVPYKSQNDGVMHACGHDSHVACLLGAAEILMEHRDDFPGTIKLVFQPAEEGRSIDGESKGGALPMIEEGVLGDPENPKIDAALALHITTDYPVNQMVVKDGSFTGSADEFYIDIIGEGGHSSAPHNAVDPVFIASQINVAIQGFLSRIVNPMESVVFTIGKISGGTRQNIIPETARLEGTLRTLNEEVREGLKEKIPKFIKDTAQSYGAEAEIEIVTGYPVGNNAKKINDYIRTAIKDNYGDEYLKEENQAQLGAEDFYEFSLKGKIPAAMFWLGGENKEEGLVHPNHSNLFNFDEDALAQGTSVLASTAILYLQNES